MRYFLFFVCFLLLHPCNAKQYIDFSYDNKSCDCSPDSNNINIDSISLSLSVISEITDEASLACGYHCIGVSHYQKNNYQEAIQAYEKAIEIRERINDKDLQKSYGNIGFCYRHIEHYSKALRYFEKIDESYIDAQVYRYIAECHSALGEYEKARYNSLKSIKEASGYDKCQGYNTRCFIFVNFRDSLKVAAYYANKAIKCFENDVKKNGYSNDIEISRANNNKGNALMWSGQHQEAIETYNKAIEIYVRQNKKHLKARTLNNIATVLYKEGKYQQAIDALNKSLLLKKNHYKNTPFKYTYAANHENLAENYEALGNIDKALQHYQLALQNLTNNFRNQDINANPKTTDNHYIYNKPDLLRVLDLKAQAALKNDNTDLAYNTYQDLDEWINELYKDLSTNESKLTWIARAHDIYTNAIEVALKKDDKAKAFQYAEKARAVLLWQSHSKQAALNLLSNEGREKQEDILVQIRQADLQYRDGDIDISKLRSLENEQDNLEKHFEEKYPEYAKRKYQPKAITVADVQNNMLNRSTALVEYHWSNDILYIFTLSQKDIFIDTVNIDIDFHQHIARFNTAVKSSGSDLMDLTKSGYSIYKKILAPALYHLNGDIKKLTILPDGKLNYIPFEALPTQKVNQPFNIPYLIDDYTINYLYSCNTYGEITAKEHTQSFLGIAPSYEKTEGLDNLDHNKAEVQAINKMYGGKVLLGTQATRQAITQDTSNIIHIASHATQGKGDGKIYLYGDDVLTQKDIQAHTWNHVQQVILSACETGTGELSKGEGVLSLGWSFVYRGVPSVVMSQWKVDDVSTKKLMLDYHKKLQEKIPADEALRQAKLDFRKSEGDVKKHPYFWAAFIHTGNPPSQQVNIFGAKTWYLIPTFLLIAIVTFLYRRNGRS